MSFIYYTREELQQILPMISDSKLFSDENKGYNIKNFTFYKQEKLEKIRELLLSCRNPKYTEKELNQELWKVLGSGYELYLMMKIPFRNLPLLINDHRGTPIEDLIKIRFTIGK